VPQTTAVIFFITNARVTRHRQMLIRRRQSTSTCARTNVCASARTNLEAAEGHQSALFENTDLGKRSEPIC